jgi:pilus assembly protein CpaB
MLRIVILIAALTAGGAAAWMALAFRGETPVTAAAKSPPPVPVQDVLVASADLGLGERLTKDNMRWQSWPESALNPAYISRSARPDALEAQPKGLADSIVRNRMISGEPIRAENLVPLNANFLSTTLPSGKRAVAVPISAQNTAGGFILPNDRVDVILTITQEKSEPVSRAILTNIPVLAIDQTVDEQSKDEQSKDGKSKDEKSKDEKSKDENGRAKAAVVGKTATLELDPSQVEILTAGQAQGTLSFALRSTADNDARPPSTPRPPLSRGQTIKFSKLGRIAVVDIIARPVELTASAKPSGPAWAPGQVIPSETQ